MRLLLAANNQATRRNEIIKATFNWVQAATDVHPACPTRTNHLQTSFLQRTQFWIRKTFSKPASLNKLQKMNLNRVLKMGVPGGPIFWDRMHRSVKEQTKRRSPLLSPLHTPVRSSGLQVLVGCYSRKQA